MFNKKFIIVLSMLFIAVGAISAVSAEDITMTDDVAMEENLQAMEDAFDEPSLSKTGSETILKEEDVSSSEVEDATVEDAEVSLSASKLTTTYSANKYFKVKVLDSQKNPVKDVKVIIKVYTGSKYKVYTVTSKENGIASLNVKSISKGTHKVVVSISNDVYMAKSITSSIKVNPKALKITTKSSKVSNSDFAGGSVDIFVKDKSSNKRLNGISLTLKIYSGKKYKTVKLVTGYDSYDKKNGVAGILTNQYSVGTHKVKITPTSSNYKGSAKAKIVITKVAKKNFYNFHIYFTKGKFVFS